MTNYRELSIMLALRAMDQGASKEKAMAVAMEAVTAVRVTSTLQHALHEISSIFANHGLR